MTGADALVLKFDPQTVDHLGARMYSHLPNAVAELVANAYDADAREVTVKLEVDGSIQVIDDGHGMSRDDVAEKYLHIGRNRRTADDTDRTESGARIVSGKKGLGKLALFGIGSEIELATTREGLTARTTVTMSYSKMMTCAGDYYPDEAVSACSTESHGTQIHLRHLKRATDIDAASLASSLARLFNYMDADFTVNVVDSSGTSIRVTPELRLSSLAQEFTWTLPEEFSPTQDGYLLGAGVSGLIVSTEKPLRHGLRGITLYANGRLVNEPEFFGGSESSFAFSYLTGHMNVDFIDGLGTDVIATDRRSLDWENPETVELRDHLSVLTQRIGQEWRTKRDAARKSVVEARLGGDTASWIDSIQAPERQPVERAVTMLTSVDADISPGQQAELLAALHEIAPPYAEYVWRHLHAEIQDATRKYYESHDYYQAVQEAIKRYVTFSRQKAGIAESEAMKVVTAAFGRSGKLRIFSQFTPRPNFSESTVDNIEDGQKHLSMGVVAGFRNPLAHEEIAELHSSGAFTYEDCLDGLAIVSYLMRRITGT